MNEIYVCKVLFDMQLKFILYFIMADIKYMISVFISFHMPKDCQRLCDLWL